MVTLNKSSMAASVVILATVFLALCVDARSLQQVRPVKATVLDALNCDATFGILKAAIDKAGLTEALSNPDADVTVFAPTDTAFEALGLSEDELLGLDNLANILKYHVIVGKKTSDDLRNGVVLGRSNGEIATTLFGPELEVSVDGDDELLINGVMITWPDLQAENGIVHAVNAVIMPPKEESNEETTDDGEDVTDNDTNDKVSEPVLG